LLHPGCRKADFFGMTDATRDRIDELTAALARTHCLQGLRPDILVGIASHIDYHHYQADQIVILENGPCVGLGIIKTGRLKAVRFAASGREQTLSVLGPGEIFNAAGVFADAPNPVTIIAVIR
jgi:CRP-like cAMP-binding protein